MADELHRLHDCSASPIASAIIEVVASDPSRKERTHLRAASAEHRGSKLVQIAA